MTEPLKGDGILIAGGIVLIFGIIILIAWAINPDIFKFKKEGDDCEVEDGDFRGTYKIDEDGKCVLESCNAGWKVDGKECTKIVSTTPSATPSTTPSTTPSATPSTTPSATPSTTPSATPSTTPSATTQKFRYVRFAKTDDITNWGDRIINLGEVYVYDSSGTNVARGKTVMHDSTTTPFYKNIGKNLVD